MSDQYRTEKEVFFTSSQAAELLNISVVTLRKYILSGRLKTFKTPGGHHRIRKKDLFETLYGQDDDKNLIDFVV